MATNHRVSRQLSFRRRRRGRHDRDRPDSTATSIDGRGPLFTRWSHRRGFTRRHRRLVCSAFCKTAAAKIEVLLLAAIRIDSGHTVRDGKLLGRLQRFLLVATARVEPRIAVVWSKIAIDFGRRHAITRRLRVGWPSIGSTANSVRTDEVLVAASLVFNEEMVATRAPRARVRALQTSQFGLYATVTVIVRTAVTTARRRSGATSC